jgi:hypothetical protein
MLSPRLWHFGLGRSRLGVTPLFNAEFVCCYGLFVTHKFRLLKGVYCIGSLVMGHLPAKSGQRTASGW